MNLKTLDQTLDLHRTEALALRDALRLYYYRLQYFSSERPLYLSETMSIRPMVRVHDKMVTLLGGTWPRTKHNLLKTRKWRVGFDELLQLNTLMVAGDLFAAESSYRSDFNSIYLKINQKALNLTSHFTL